MQTSYRRVRECQPLADRGREEGGIAGWIETTRHNAKLRASHMHRVCASLSPSATVRFGHIVLVFRPPPAMQSINRFLYGPTPEEKVRAWQAKLRSEQRVLEREMRQVRQRPLE